MKQSEISFIIDLDEENVPEQIIWKATDNPQEGPSTTKSISISLWDEQQKNTLRIDLWTKDMPVDDMKRFYIDSIGGLAQSLLNATGDEFMAGEMNKLCDTLVQHMKNSRES